MLQRGILMVNDPLLEPQTSIPQILQGLIFQENCVLKLNGIDVCLHGVDDTIFKTLKLGAIQKHLHTKYLDDVEFMRKLKLYSTMMGHTETALELLGADFISHQEYIYSAETEQEISELNKYLNKIIGLLLKEYSKGETIDI